MLFRRLHDSLLFRSEHYEHEVRVVFRHVLLERLIDHLKRELRHKHLHHLILHVDTRHGISVEEMTHTLVDIARVLHLVLLRIAVLKVGKVFLLEAVILGLSESETCGA